MSFKSDIERRVKGLEGRVNPKYYPFSCFKSKMGIDERVRLLELSNDKMWRHIDGLVKHLNLETEEVSAHLKFKKKRK